MDLAPHPEHRGDVPEDNPRQEHSIGPPDPVSRTFAVISHPAAHPHVMPLWLRRVMLFIFVAFAIEVGMFLVVLPWYDSGRLWTENSLLLGFPNLRAFLAQDFIRGLVSGMGLVDIWVGIWEAVHYKEAIHQ